MPDPLVMPAMRTDAAAETDLFGRDLHARVGGHDGPRYILELVRGELFDQTRHGIRQQLRIQFHTDDTGGGRQNLIGRA